MDAPEPPAAGKGPAMDLLTAVPSAFGCYGLDHQPISMLEGSMLLASPDRIVARDTIAGVEVSTVFLIFDHDHSRTGAPVLYETMVFRSGMDASWCERYRTREAALAGHDRACAWVRSPEQAPAPLADLLP